MEKKSLKQLQTKLITTYFSKSKWFLYPAIINDGKFVPSRTFISSPDLGITLKDYKIITLFSKENNNEFEEFSRKVLLTNPDLLSFQELDSYFMYIFSMKNYKVDFDYFVNGKYSKLSKETKDKILSITKKNPTNVALLKIYLFPYSSVDYFENMIDFFGENSRSALLEVGELCSKPDLIKETMYYESIMNIKSTV